MNIIRYRKNKIEWTVTYIFGSLCFDYFENFEFNESNVKKLEKILFLMQIWSLEEYGVPLLVYETYYHNSEIYLKYLSDILRVASPDLHGDIHFEKINRKYRYNDILKEKYMHLTEKELNDKIGIEIKNNKLDYKYFKLEKCKHRNFYRKCARFQVSFLGGIFMLCGLIALGNIVILVLTVIMYFYELSTGNDIYPVNEGIGAVFISSPALIGCFLLLKRMTKPTKFELENNFDVIENQE